MEFFFSLIMLTTVCVVIIAAVNKENRVLGLCASIILGVIIITYVYPYLTQIISTINNLVDKMGQENEQWVLVIIKVTIIALLGEWALTICKDAGENALSVKLEIALKVLLIAVSAPLLLKLTEILISLLGEL